MVDFYLKPKVSFDAFGIDPLHFDSARFYEVMKTNDSHSVIRLGDQVFGCSNAEVNERFERFNGSFIELVANRPVFKLVASLIAQYLWVQGLPPVAGDSLKQTIEQELQRFFKNDTDAQPDTKLTDWEFTIIDHGKPKLFLSDVINDHCRQFDLEAVKLNEVNLTIKFDTEDSFLSYESEMVTKLHRYTTAPRRRT